MQKLLPGLTLVALLSGLAYAAARLPYLGVIGPLVLGLGLGLAWRAAAGLPPRAEPGARFAAKTLLKLGIVLLGVRLDFALLAAVGPAVLLGNVLVVGLGIWLIERLGRRLGLSRGLRLALAVGTSVCGASAIAAAVPVVGARDEEAGISVSIISVLGVLGVLAYLAAYALFEPPATLYGVLVGSTLQEVAQVVAAGYTPGGATGDLALLVKLARVALLAPALITINLLLRREARQAPQEGAPSAKLPPLVPWFLSGFLLVGVLNSLGAFPEGVRAALQFAGLALTVLAMTGIGLGTDLSAWRRLGREALLLGAAGGLILLAIMLPYALLAL